MEHSPIKARESPVIGVISRGSSYGPCKLPSGANSSIARPSASCNIFVAVQYMRMFHLQNFPSAHHIKTISLTGSSTMLSLIEFSMLGHLRLLFHTIPSFTRTFSHSFFSHTRQKIIPILRKPPLFKTTACLVTSAAFAL